MITSTTPYKLAEIIMDTWPNLYRPPKDYKPPSQNGDRFSEATHLLKGLLND
jgi:hypothetical protein